MKYRGLYIIGVRSAFGPYKRDGCDIAAARNLLTGLHLCAKRMKIMIKNPRKALFMEAKKGT